MKTRKNGNNYNINNNGSNFNDCFNNIFIIKSLNNEYKNSFNTIINLFF